jgi:hypothetical protein
MKARLRFAVAGLLLFSVAVAESGASTEPQALSAAGATKLNAHGLRGMAERYDAVGATPLQRSYRPLSLLPRPDPPHPASWFCPLVSAQSPHTVVRQTPSSPHEAAAVPYRFMSLDPGAR